MHRQAAVLGRPVGHSLSPVLHAAAYQVLGLDWTYVAHEVDEASLAAFLDGLDRTWVGLSLTMPLKRVAFELCSTVSSTAQLVGAVNTITFAPDRTRCGDNTDVPGMVNALAEIGIATVSSAAVLGGGATAASTLAALAAGGAREVHLFVRTPGRADELAPLAQALGVELVVRSWAEAGAAMDFPLVVATTPGGGTDLLAGALPTSCGTLFDVAYDPWPTALAQAWARNGGKVLSGLDLLVHQAVLQVELMSRPAGVEPISAELAAELVREMRTAGLAVLATR
jgi:shikimate dehydrogenase